MRRSGIHDPALPNTHLGRGAKEESRRGRGGDHEAALCQLGRAAAATSSTTRSELLVAGLDGVAAVVVPRWHTRRAGPQRHASRWMPASGWYHMVGLAGEERVKVGAHRSVQRHLRRGREGRGVVYVGRRPRRARRGCGMGLGALPRGGILHRRGRRVLPGGRRGRSLRRSRYFEAHAPGTSSRNSVERGAQDALEEVLLRRTPVRVGTSSRLSRRDIDRNSDDDGADNWRPDRNLRHSHSLDWGRWRASRRIGHTTRGGGRGRDMAAESSLHVLQVLLEVLLKLMAAPMMLWLIGFGSGGRCRGNRCRHRCRCRGRDG